MKPTFTLLAALLLASLATLHVDRDLPGVPTIGILRAGFFHVLQTLGAMASNDCN